MAEHIQATLGIMTADYHAALRHARQSVTLATECGQSLSLAASLGNFGHLLYIAGQFDEDREQNERALHGFSPRSDNFYAILDTLARIEFTEGHMEACAELIQRIEHTMDSKRDQRRYVYRHNLVTKAMFKQGSGQLSEALHCLATMIALAQRTDDQWLWKLGVIHKLDVLSQMGQFDVVISMLNEVGPRLAGLPLDLFALYEGALACCLVAVGTQDEALEHRMRADRLFAMCCCR